MQVRELRRRNQSERYRFPVPPRKLADFFQGVRKSMAQVQEGAYAVLVWVFLAPVCRTKLYEPRNQAHSLSSVEPPRRNPLIFGRQRL